MRIVVYKNNMTTGRGADRAVATFCGLLAAKHSVTFVTSEGAPLSCSVDPLIHLVRVPLDLPQLAQGIIAAKPDIVISTGTDEIGDLDAAFPAAFPAPVIQQFHIYPPSAFKPRRWFRNARTKRALRRCAAIQVLLPEYVELTRKLLHYDGIIRAIGNVAPNVKPLPPFQEKPVILYPAAFHKAKRQDLLLRAFALLKKRVPAAELALAGRGSAKETVRLQELASKLGIKESVNFLGYQPDLEPVYAKSTLVAFPSRTEGFGLALVEAASYGRLTVGCVDCLASSSLVPKLGGLLAEPTPEALASVLERALQLAPAYSVPTAALEEFSSETIAAQWNALISPSSGYRVAEKYDIITSMRFGKMPLIMNTELLLPFVVPHRTWWWARLSKERTAVCMLHSVGADCPLPPDCPLNNMIEPEKLRGVIRLLKNANYAFTTFGAAFGAEGTPKSSRRRVCLTFDDGYVDNYTTLFPILKEEGVCATFFVTNRGETDSRFLSAAQIQELDQSGLVEIGGHTESHCFMLHTAKASAKREIESNKAWLEVVLGHSITSFAYPRGEYDEEIVRFVKDAGYTCAATMEKHQRLPPTDRYHIHRQILPRGKSPYELYLLATREKFKI